uniref:Uncharacterized protein n=1 Tax=Panagrolaimus sp. ES5 TaxID=591445 RepID=A0AC34FVE1_9BILA
MTAVDPSTDVEYTATLKLKFYEFPGSAYVEIDSSPKLESFDFEGVNKLWISVNSVTKRRRTFKLTPLDFDRPKSIVNRLKEMWKNDPLNDFTMKCGENEVKKFSVTKMTDSVSPSNIQCRIKLANHYGLKEFKKWCMQFAFRNNIEIDL